MILFDDDIVSETEAKEVHKLLSDSVKTGPVMVYLKVNGQDKGFQEVTCSREGYYVWLYMMKNLDKRIEIKVEREEEENDKINLPSTGKIPAR